MKLQEIDKDFFDKRDTYVYFLPCFLQPLLSCNS